LKAEPEMYRGDCAHAPPGRLRPMAALGESIFMLPSTMNRPSERCPAAYVGGLLGEVRNLNLLRGVGHHV